MTVPSSSAAPLPDSQGVLWPNRTGGTAVGTGTGPLGLPGHDGDTAPGPFAPQLREGGGQRAAKSPRSHRTEVKVPLTEDVAAPVRSAVSHGYVGTPSLAWEIPGEGPLSQPCHHHPPQGRLPPATSQSAALALGRGLQQQGLGISSSAGMSHPAGPTQTTCPPHGTVFSPGHLTMGSESNSSAGLGTLGTCVTVTASLNWPTPAWGSLAPAMSWGEG